MPGAWSGGGYRIGPESAHVGRKPGSKEGQREGARRWRRGREGREGRHSRILEQDILATNETPTVVEHGAAGEDDEDGVFRGVYSLLNTQRRSSTLLWTLTVTGSRVSNGPDGEIEPLRRTFQSHQIHVQNMQHAFDSMRATASTKAKNANGRRRRVACGLDAGGGHTEENHVFLGLQTTLKCYFRAGQGGRGSRSVAQIEHTSS